MLTSFAEFVARFDNLFIFLLAIANGILFGVDLNLRKEAEALLRPVGDKHYGVTGTADIKREDAVILRKARDRVVKCYSIYANFTAIFPLLGILGTVASLVTLVGSTDLSTNLMTALTTTLNGVFWAIVFKALDSLLSSPLDTFLDDLDFVVKKAEKATPDFKVKKRPDGTVEYVASFGGEKKNETQENA